MNSDLIKCNLNWSINFIINPSVNKISYTNILVQNNDSGIDHPNYYINQDLNQLGIKYIKSKKIILVLLFACSKFKHYLYASKFIIKVQYS